MGQPGGREADSVWEQLTYWASWSKEGTLFQDRKTFGGVMSGITERHRPLSWIR